MSKPNESRDEELRKAAEFRAAASAYFNRTEGLRSATQFSEENKELVERLEYKQFQVSQSLKRMADNKLLYCRREGTANLFGRPGSAFKEFKEVMKGRMDEEFPVPAPVVEKPKAATRTPQVSMDIVRSTGRVRLSLDGLVIEIGVVDD